MLREPTANSCRAFTTAKPRGQKTEVTARSKGEESTDKQRSSSCFLNELDIEIVSQETVSKHFQMSIVIQ